jgi:3-oxoacyl-[acyl-carrier protein] reductase
MADRYVRFAASSPGRFLTRRLGLPQPADLLRWDPERPSLDGPVLHLTAARSRHADTLGAAVASAGLETRAAHEPGARYAAVVLDATGVAAPGELSEVYAALHPVLRSVAPCGRVVLVGAEPEAADHHQAATQQALEGIARSLGKETGGGRTVQLLRLADGAAPAAASTLRFLLSPRSAYVSGQVIRIALAAPAAPDGRPRTALVTGAARGIGEAVAATLARDGATHVVCLDVPQAAEPLEEVARRLGGTALTVDITADHAGERIAAALPDGLDVLVHNAGIARDRRLVNMPADRWKSVIDVNLGSVLRVTDHLLKTGTVRTGGRIVATASISGIAGNTGQTNYAASKAGIMGFVRSLAQAPETAERGITVNAVAPGFIETKMTAAVPFFIREAGRRMNSLGQGGQPVDVAETVAWFAEPDSGGVNGQVVRVCGQSLLGA